MSAQNNANSAIHVQTPHLSPDLQKDLEIYQEDMEILAQVKAKLKALAKSIKNHGNVMYEVIQVFSLYQDDQASQIRSLSAVDNLDSTLRGKLSAAQSDWNTMGGSPAAVPHIVNHQLVWKFPKDPKATAAAKDLVKQIDQIEAFIKYEQGQKNPILDKASLSNLQSAISSIKSNFEGSWGHTELMEHLTQKWLFEVHSGQNVPAMKNIQDGFQTLNQSVSELSSTTNSQLQFVENQYKQGLGEENSAIQAYQKMNANTIRHFTSQ